MRFRKWLGMVSAASPYALPPGANRLQVNLQNVTPGQLTPRGGVSPVADSLLVNNFSTGIVGNAMISLFRGAAIGSAKDTFLGFTTTTTNPITTAIRNLTTGTVLATGVFQPSVPVSVCQDRFGNYYFFQGMGVRPRRWSGSDLDPPALMGIEAPPAPPTVTRQAGAAGYYIERVNVTDGGAAYWTPPAITITGTLNSGGTAASLRAVVEAGVVTAINVIEPGNNYAGPVTLTFDESSAATNTFAATATLATATTPGQYGMTNTSALSKTGSIASTSTVAVGQNNASVNYFVGNSTTTDADVPASLNNSIWTANNIPIYRTSDNTDSGARISVTFSNTTHTWTATTGYRIAAETGRTTPAGYNTSAISFCTNNPPIVNAWGTTLTYPQVQLAAPGGTSLADLRYDSGAGKFYADLPYGGGNGTIRVVFSNATGAIPWNWHPDLGSGVFWLLPSAIDSVSILNGGTNYSAASVQQGITAFDPSTNTTFPTAGTLVETFSTAAITQTNSLQMPQQFQSFTVTNPGTGWSVGNTGYVQFASRPKANNTDPLPGSYSLAEKITLTVVLTASGSTGITGAVASVNVTNGASNLLVPPQILYTGTGYGLELSAAVVNGSIPTGTGGITVVDGGAGFTSPPTLSIRTGGAKATAVMRPTMQGRYQCAYRYFDDSVTAAAGGPIYSSFSPIIEYDAGPTLGYTSTNAVSWSAPASAPSRARGVEVWRTSSDQALVFYRVATLAGTTSGTLTTDALSDEQLFDPDRAGYAALPVVLPNGDLNAYRFGVPRSDMSVCVAFQDRLFYGVSTSGQKPNSIFYSEFDEFESCPDINELTIQQNVKEPDVLSALAPFSGQLLAFQKFHCYALNYLDDPSVDGNIQLMAYRGCWNQRCWEIFEGQLYAVDDRGVYSMTAGGGVESLSDAIKDIFQNKIYRSASGTPDSFVHLKIDPITRVLRVFCTLLPDAVATQHSTALCYSLDMKSWWIERYPTRIICAAALKDDVQRVYPVYGTNTRVVRLDSGYEDWARTSITGITITNPGSGYTTPPQIVFANGECAVLDPVLDGSGRVKSIVIKHGGTGYTNNASFTTVGGGGSGCVGTITTTTTTASGALPSSSVSVPWWFQSGNMELVTDRESLKNGNQQSRAVALTYKPTQDSRKVHLRLFYNNSQYARPNFARRDRGTGFVEDIIANSSVLDMESDRTEIGATASGVSIARFAGRGIDDAVGNDRHVAVEISSDQPSVIAAPPEPIANQPIVYEVDVQGVVEAA